MAEPAKGRAAAVLRDIEEEADDDNADVDSESPDDELDKRIDITEDGLVWKKITKRGAGKKPSKGTSVDVHYVGTLESDGSKFDSSRDRGDPFKFTIGEGVIQGWSLAVPTMRKGEIAEVHIASKYGYGDTGSGDKIPGGATLVFEIELIKINKSSGDTEPKRKEAEQLCELGNEKFRAGDFQAAVDLYESAWRVTYGTKEWSLSNEKGRIARNLATVYARLEWWDDCLVAARRAVKARASEVRGQLKLIEALLHVGSYDEAKQAYDKALTSVHEDKEKAAIRAFAPRLAEFQAIEEKRQLDRWKQLSFA